MKIYSLLPKPISFALMFSLILQASCSVVAEEPKEQNAKQEMENTEETNLATKEIAAVVHITDVLGKIMGMIEPEKDAESAPRQSLNFTQSLAKENGSGAKKYYNPFQYSFKIFQELGIARYQAGSAQDEFSIEFLSLESKALLSPATETSLIFWGKKKKGSSDVLEQFSISVRVKQGDMEYSFPFFSYQSASPANEHVESYLFSFEELNKFYDLAMEINPSIEIGKMVGSVKVTKDPEAIDLDFTLSSDSHRVWGVTNNGKLVSYEIELLSNP